MSWSMEDIVAFRLRGARLAGRVPLHTPAGSGCSCHVRDCGSPGKHPRTVRGLRDASTDPERIHNWWERWQHANLGVATGAVSGLMVLDVGLPDGPASPASLVADRGPLPATCEQRTGSGGRQLLSVPPRSAGRQPGCFLGSTCAVTAATSSCRPPPTRVVTANDGRVGSRRRDRPAGWSRWPTAPAPPRWPPSTCPLPSWVPAAASSATPPQRCTGSSPVWPQPRWAAERTLNRAAFHLGSSPRRTVQPHRLLKRSPRRDPWAL